MNWFRSKYRDLAESLAEQLDETRSALELERTKRIGAEALAESRRQELDRAWEAAGKAEASRDEAVKQRMASVDLVNTHLLKAREPESPINIKDYPIVPKQTLQAVAQMRKYDRQVMTALINKGNKKPEVPAAPAVQ